MEAFSRLSLDLQTPNCRNLSEKLPKVSGQIPRYSRFWETFRGDRFRSALGGRVGRRTLAFRSLNSLRPLKVPPAEILLAISRPKSVRSRNLALHLMSFREVKAE